MAIALTSIGTASGKAVSSITITLPADIPAGCTIFVNIAVLGNHLVNIADSFGQTNWVGGNGQTSTNVTTLLDWCWNAFAMNAGNTITVSAASGTLTMAASAFYATGLYTSASPIDGSGGNTGTGTSPSITGGATSRSPDLIVACLATDGPSTDSFTQDVAYTDITRVGTTGGSDVTCAGGTLTSASTSASVYAPTIASEDWAGYVAAFKSALTLTGVAGTGAVGTMIAAVKPNLTGLAATSAIGTPTVSGGSQPTVLGLQSTAAIGFLTPYVTPNQTLINLTGLHATAAVGRPQVKPQAILIGQAATAHIGIPQGVVFASGMFLTDLTVETIPLPVTDIALNVRWSDTEGYSWSDSVQRTIGAQGAYLTSIQVRRLGMSRRGRVFELSWSSPAPTALMGASIMFEDSST